MADNTYYGAGTYGAGLYNLYNVQPGSTADAETLGGPTVGATYIVTPAGISDTETLGGPSISTGYTATPASLNDTQTFGSPAATGAGQLAPFTLSDAETFGGPTVVSYGYLPYSTGNYGQGTYNGGSISATSVTPTGINDAQTLDRPDLSGPATAPTVSNDSYGSGTYGQGVYAGLAAVTAEHPLYGTGLYGTGTYYGFTAPSVPPAAPESAPALYEYDDIPRPAQQILGIGPWSPIVVYRGAVNVGIGKGKRPAAPIMAMPASSSLSYTLRLTGGNEASASFALPRGSAIIIEEMHTDLWWRRKDPITGQVETIGRFNASTNDLSSDGGSVTSSVHWVDYETLLGERMVLKYLTTVLDSGGHITSATSMWDKGTPLTQIMRFAVPTNMGIDLSAIQTDGFDLGVTTDAFTLPPDSTIADMFTNLLPISGKAWEWWIEQPDNVSAAPKLSFTIGTRGNPTDVVLFDLGAGASPIDSWTMTAATTQYANALYYTGSSGGVIYTIDGQIQEFGQRDAKDGDSNLVNIDHLQAAAKKKLAALADRRPTFTVKLRAGFWGGRTHIDVGDSIRLVLKMGDEVINYTYRVSEISVDIDEYGVENVSLTLGTPRPSGDPRSRHSAVLRLVRRILNYVVPPGSDGSTGTTPTT